MKEFIKTELSEALAVTSHSIINRWLARGDGVAVYQNVEIGGANSGHRQFVSYGSPDAQIETAEPPVRMPDIGGRINWRYQLEGTYKGEAL